MTYSREILHNQIRMNASHIAPLLLMALAVSGVLYMRVRFPSPSTTEEIGARVVTVVLFVFLSAAFLMPR
ncbi:MAG TPA: hypothetical protein VKU01_23655 [Bryobacteraceae bacterium]|nr:hypothetical protein [Bryobacteraceae bacterium]